MFVIGTLTYIGLLILGVRYAVPLAVLAGLFEAIPNIGPISSAIPSILLNTADHGFFSGGSVTILYFIIQQFENTIIVPFIMKKAVGIHPIYTLISLVIGGKIGGVLGVLLAIPTFLVLDTLLREFVHHKGKKY